MLAGQTMAAQSGDGWSLSDDSVLTVTKNIEKSFLQRSDIKTVVIEAPVTTICAHAFNQCVNLTDVTISNTVTTIERSAFYFCIGLTSITLPESLESIELMAFAECRGITSITIPKSVKTIGNMAFTGCDNMVEINCDPENPVYTSIDGILYNRQRNELVACPTNKTDEIVVPNFVKRIGPFSFEGRSITSVILPDSVEYIGSSAFYGCVRLTSISLGKCLKSIGEEAFYNCYRLDTLGIPSTITDSEIGKDAFYNVRNVRCSKIIGSHGAISMNGIVDGDFVYSNEDKVNIYAYIGKSEKVSVPKGVKLIGKRAFYACDNIVELTVPNTVEYILSNAFYRVRNVVYSGEAIGSPWGACVVNGIVDGDFIFSSKIPTLLMAYIGKGGNVTIPQGTTILSGGGIFEDCDNLLSVYIPSSVTDIGSETFNNCRNLNWVNVPKSVATITRAAFNNCRNATIYCETDKNKIPKDWADGIAINVKEVVFGKAIVTASISVVSNDTTYGSVSGSGNYMKDSPAIIKAYAYPHYRFIGWSDGNTDNPRTIIATNDVELTAIFEPDENQGGNEGGNENQGGNETNPATVISDNVADKLVVYAHGNTIVVENATEEIRIYNAMGALVCRDVARNVSTVAESDIRAELQVNVAGVYIVKVGNAAKRVMIND